MAGFNQGTKALAQAVAGVEHAIAVLDRRSDDAAYQVRQAEIWLDRARVKHVAHHHVPGAEFVAEVEKARLALEQ